VRVARFLVAISGWFWEDLDVRWATVNGLASALLVRDGAVYGVLTVSACAEGIDQVLWMVNPDKLTAFAP
ncbi:MAG TPA: RNA polymerase subunit sigma-24, partial [Phytomonospora sp.]